MASFGQVRTWNPDPLHASVGELNQRCDQLLGLADELAAACQPTGWVGDAAYAAARESRKRTDMVEERVAGVAAVRRALGEAADAVSALRHAVAEADSFAQAKGFVIGDDGSVNDAGPPREIPVEQARERDRVRTELTDRVDQILRRAQDIDEDLTTVVNRARAGQTLDGDPDGLTSAAQAGASRGGLSVLEPPKSGSVYDNAGWWDSLSATEQQQIIKQHPEWIGNRDGVPAAARDQANRARIPGERAALQRQIDELNARLRAIPSNQRDPRLMMFEQQKLRVEIEKAKAKLASIEAMEHILNKPGGRQLLVMDMSGDRAKAAIASGNVDAADHVAVFTPGMNSTVNGALDGYDNDMENLRVRAQRELERFGDGGTVAAITWLGYEPPSTSENPWDAAGQGLARDGANRLAPFLNGIDASRDNDPHMTALGHSYGSLTTGLALQQNTGVDDAVVFGSPGLGTSDPGKILVGQGQLYNLEADGDIVADLGDDMIHGIDPSNLPIPQLSTHDAVTPDGRPMHASSGHSEYTRDDTTSQYNMSVIVAGMPNRVVPN